jgi:hypothetical protein
MRARKKSSRGQCLKRRGPQQTMMQTFWVGFGFQTGQENANVLILQAHLRCKLKAKCLHMNQFCLSRTSMKRQSLSAGIPHLILTPLENPACDT